MERSYTGKYKASLTAKLHLQRGITYLHELFALGTTVGQCRLVYEFFGIWRSDLDTLNHADDREPVVAAAPQSWPLNNQHNGTQVTMSPASAALSSSPPTVLSQPVPVPKRHSCSCCCARDSYAPNCKPKLVKKALKTRSRTALPGSMDATEEMRLQSRSMTSLIQVTGTSMNAGLERSKTHMYRASSSSPSSPATTFPPTFGDVMMKAQLVQRRRPREMQFPVQMRGDPNCTRCHGHGFIREP
ncbi:hypothetical protein B0O80DRAFT_488233 [Mortierella sp. GBAus27b]|nr:hypothetical protein B0O80DRAFT_488233 [Mortierella sp. GBAus27b]